MNTRITNSEIPIHLYPEIQVLEQTRKEFLSALIIGKHNECNNLVNNYLEKDSSIKNLYEELLKKTLYKVGELWEFNKISVATEHLASAIVESILNQLYPTIISNEKINKLVIASCVENEYHQIGIKMISDVFEMNGWDALFLGSNLPTSELIEFVRLRKPDLLALSLSLYFNIPKLELMINQVHHEFPDLPILVGGQAFQHGGVDLIEKYHNVFYQNDTHSTELFIKNFK